MVTKWKNIQTAETASLTKFDSGIIYATFYLYGNVVAIATYYSTMQAKATFNKSNGWIAAS